MKFTSYIASKPNVQKMLSALRKANFTVIKDSGGYKAQANNKELFRAMNGSKGYLVRHVENLFTIEQS